MNMDTAKLIKAAVPEAEGRNARILSQNVSDHKDPNFLSQDFPRQPPRLYITAESDDFDAVTIAEWQAEGFDVQYLPMGNGGDEYLKKLKGLKGNETTTFETFGIVGEAKTRGNKCSETRAKMDLDPWY
jgi:hypothetical protein